MNFKMSVVMKTERRIGVAEENRRQELGFEEKNQQQTQPVYKAEF